MIKKRVKNYNLLFLNPKSKAYGIASGFISRNYPSDGLNTITTNNYYVVRTDLKPNFDNRELTDYEKEWDYTVKYIKLDDALELLEKSISDAKKKNPVLDTIEAVKEYIKICGDDTRRVEWR